MQQSDSAFAVRAAGNAGLSLQPADRVRWLILEHLRYLGESIEALQDGYAEAVNLYRVDLDAVSHLSEGPLAMGVLGKRLALTPGAVTGLVDRLERAGHVRRVPAEHDRRQTMVELSPAAMQLVGTFFGGLAQRLMAQLQAYTDDELATIERFLAALPMAIDPEGRAGRGRR